MTRKLLLLALFLAAFLPLAGQNNPYQIDDECYAVFCECETKLGTEECNALNEKMLSLAIQKDDKKAQVIYYVERLKNEARMVPTGVMTTEEQDEKVLRYQEDLKAIADKLGFSQYYYYSYELVQTYFYNHKKPLRTMELVQEMQQTAIERKDHYGEWIGYRYLVSLYKAMDDYVSSKKYIREAIRIYNETDDPVVKRQSVSRLYCDLADTYPIGSDSVRICVNKAAESAILHLDSLRCHYHLAKIEALEKNFDEYYRHRDICLKDSSLPVVSKGAPLLFKTIDSIIDGWLPSDLSIVNKLGLREIKYLANICEEYGYKETAFQIEKMIVVREEQRLSMANQSKLTELDARMGNNALSAEVYQKSLQVNRITMLVAALVALIFAVVLVFVLLHIRNLKRTQKRDEQRIEELKEANEKVRLADAAKTRFVQNMSHEVRTPLNAIVGFSQLLSLPDGSFPEEEKAEFAGHIVNNTKMLTMLLDDILNASAMDSGNYKISYEQGECGFMCNAAISSAEHRLQPGVGMVYEPEFSGPHTFVTDPRRVQQILINLLTNACKHTTEGTIVLSCSLDENPGEVTFAVTDNGPGVPDEQAEVIFDRFTKLNEFVQGTGLGLSICRDIASRMGGRVFLDTSYKKGGARFVFVVPEEPIKNETTNLQ